MNYPNKILNSVKRRLFGNISDAEISMLARERFGLASKGIVPYYIPQRQVSLDTWQASMDMAKSPYTLSRFQLYRVYDNAVLDLHLSSIMESRLIEVVLAKYRLVDKDGNEDIEATKLLQAKWFADFVKYSMESEFFGYSLIELTDTSSTPKTVKLNSGNKTLYPLTKVSLIDRAHVRPEKGKWLVNSFDPIEAGYPYIDEPDNLYYIGVGKTTNLGLLAKLAPIAIAKRYSTGAWSEFNEKLGIPFRTVEMQGNNKDREKLLSQILTNMGSAGWAILHPGEKMELLNTAGSDVHKCFMELSDFCDKQMSKAVLGQTMTTDEGGSLAQAKVHENTGNKRHEYDRINLEYLINDELIPRLVKLGYPLEGYTYERYDHKEETLEDRIKRDSLLLQYYDIDPEYIAQRYNIDVAFIKPKAVAAPVKPTQAQPEIDKEGNIIKPSLLLSQVLQEYLPNYPTACGHLHKPITMVDADSVAEPYQKELKSIYNAIYKNEAASIPHEAALGYFQSLFTAWQQGYGEAARKPVFNSPDNLRIAMAEANIARFSAAGTFKDVLALNKLARTSPDFQTFQAQAGDYTKAKNAHLKTEYDNAFSTAQSAAAWTRQAADKDLYDLKYQTVGDARVRDNHKALDGFVAPVDDPIWQRVYTPNGWRCRCEVIQVPKGQASEVDITKVDINAAIQKGFDFNPGLSYTVFNNTTGYLKDWFPNEKLNPKVYGLITSQQFLEQDRSNFDEGNIPNWNQQDYKTWWEKKQNTDGNVYLQNYLGVNLKLDKTRLEDKFTKDGYEGQNRFGIANALTDILTNPDEVWVHKNNSRNKSRAEYESSYIRSYKDGNYAVIVGCESKSDVSQLEVITWYKIKDDAGEIGARRNGLLVKKKAN